MWVEGVAICINWIWCQVGIKDVWWFLVLGDALLCCDVLCKCKVENDDHGEVTPLSSWNTTCGQSLLPLNYMP